jgi:hypothetical protein
MKKIIIVFFLAISMSSCWAPRCPIKTCHVRHEHQHGDLVTGVFSDRYLYPPRIHFLWDSKKGTLNPDAKFEGAESRKQKKMRKKFPWERW